MSDTLNTELADIFADVMDCDPDDLSPATNADDVPEWDSLSNVRLIMAIERAFKAQFSNDDIAGWTCLGDIQTSLKL